MDPDHESKLLALEKALYDESVDPIDLPLSLLKAITNNFSEGHQIGSGGFGEVYKGELPNGTVAVKRLFNFITIDEKNFQSEVDSLLGVRHKNTVRFLGYCSDTQQVMDKFNGATVWAERRQRLLCFEFLPKGSLVNYITDPSSGLQWETRYQIIKGICEGVHYLHQQRIVHMDLKPQNILLDGNMMPKIADFGLSRRLSEDQSRHITEDIVGSLGYWAPEFIGSGVITFKTDIYGLGVIFLEVLMGCKGSEKVEEVLKSWMNVLGTIPGCHILLEQVKVCVEIGIQCMDDDPKNRPTTWDIIARLFDEEDISNWSARGVVSIAQTRSFINKLEDELKSMKLYGRPFLPKLVSPLKSVGETNTETMSPTGLTDHELLDVYPLELRFSFETNKRISCPLSLTNKSDQYVLFLVRPEFTDMYLCEENLCALGLLMPMSTCGVSITLVEQQQHPRNTNNLIYILMITSESESILQDLMSFLQSDNNTYDDLPQQIEKLGCQMHVAMVTAVVFPQRETHEVIFTKELGSITSMDVHPTEPWILVIQNHRQVSIWNHGTQAVVMSFNSNEKQGWFRKMLDDDVCVHAAKFIPQKQWFVTGGDYGNVRVYSCVKMTEIKKFRAYLSAPVESLAVHPTYPLLITLTEWGDYDHAIRIWDWDMDWKCSQKISQGYSCGYGTRFRFNPKDTTTFAAANNRTCHVWSIRSSEPLITISLPNYSNTVCDYLHTDSHQQYLITSSQDGCLSVWDLQTEKCVHTLVLHGNSIGPVACHPTLNLIVAGSPDGDHLIVCFWNSSNYRLLKTVRCTLGSNILDFAFVGSRRLVIGYSQGIEVLDMDLEALSRQQ